VTLVSQDQLVSRTYNTVERQPAGRGNQSRPGRRRVLDGLLFQQGEAISTTPAMVSAAGAHKCDHEERMSSSQAFVLINQRRALRVTRTRLLHQSTNSIPGADPHQIVR